MFSSPIIPVLASAGRPSLKLVHRIGRPTCTERARQDCWRAGRPPRSTAESFCSLESPGRPAESSALCSSATVDWPVDRWLNGQNSDRWPVDRAVDRQANLAPTASFFLTPLRSFLHLFESKYFQSKGEFIKSVLEVIFLSFPPPLPSLFFSETLEQPIDILNL